MQAELESIKVGYENLGLSPSQIAEDRGLDVTSVKAGLLQCSSKYRRDVGHVDSAAPEVDNKLDFDNNDLMAVNDVIRNLAVYAEDEGIRLKAAMYVRDDKKGRREIRQVLGGNTFNILAFNQNMQRVREGAERMKSLVMDTTEVANA